MSREVQLDSILMFVVFSVLHVPHLVQSTLRTKAFSTRSERMSKQGGPDLKKVSEFVPGCSWEASCIRVAAGVV